MKRLLIALSLTGMPLLGIGAAHAEGFLDTVKTMAAKPEVQSAAKSGATKAVEMVRGKPATTPAATNTSAAASPGVGGAVAANVESQINTRLLDESRKNQCSFKSNSDVLEAGCDAKAAKLANAIMAAKTQLISSRITSFKFEVSGHTDTRGNAATNKTLSEKRAAVIVKQITARGVPATDIISIGMGAEKPLVSPDNTAAKQAQNRRYEIRVRL